MRAKFCLGACLLAIWALQLAIMVVSFGATAQFTMKAIAIHLLGVSQ